MDGVFAIAMTLLVLNLKVPVIAENAPAGELGRQLLSQLPQFLSFGLSLLVLGVYWVAYTLLFQLIHRTDRLYHWVTLLYVLCVVSVPFSANLIGQYPYRLEAVLIYGLNLTVTSLVLYLNFWYAVHFKLIGPEAPPPLLRTYQKRVLSGIVVYAVTTSLAFLDTRISLTIYVFISLFFILPTK